MNFLIFQFAGGNAFFVGASLLAASLLIVLRLKGIVIRSFGRALFLIGSAAIACSGTPLDVWIYWGLGLLAVACLVACETPAAWISTQRQAAVFALFCAALAGVCGSEWRHRIAPKILVSSAERIYVVGDSVSAGVDSGIKLWPELLGDMTKREVLNFAKAGATASSALRQVAKIPPGLSLVLLEIGGNDILTETNQADFRTALDTLLARVMVDGRSAAMFELPIPPFQNAY